ncbi:MAG: hypothetical protein CM1200mP1_05420 [Candidatus Neomarinimicrobiota bacterium]|nr:MAG: hypothetical protein CM1200mP1_05420 [Candidatus Neomarinimicrobiota bacterium]
MVYRLYQGMFTYSRKNGCILALENHWGLTRTPEGLLRIVNPSIRLGWVF